MIPAKTDHVSHYVRAFDAFEEGLNGQAQSPIHDVRKNAIARFAELGFPTSRDEAWKATDLRPVTSTPFALADAAVAQTVDDARLAPFKFGLDGPTLVFVNGHYVSALSSPIDVDGITVSAAPNEAVEAHLTRIATVDAHALTALNTAFLLEVAYVHIARNVVSPDPIHILHYTVAGGEPHLAVPRALIIVDDGAKASVVQTFAGEGEGAYLNNAVTEIRVGENASLDHVKTTLEGPDGRHTDTLKISQGRSSRFISHTVSVDGAFTRNDISSVLAGEGCESTVNGFYILDGDQHCDNYTLLEHQQPHCPSHELFKGILQDRSRAVFRGKIHVHRAAQKTDAYQQNQNILLSDDARVNTKPQLEIYADDVKCSHGATIGQLDEDALFYLRARGISRPTAYRILLRAFAHDVLGQITIESLRDGLTERVLAKIDRAGARS